MNYTVIGLGIVLVILIYTLYVFLTDKTTRLSKYTSLTSTNTPITSISDPTATNYAYGIWVYVNTWDSTIQKYIYARQKNIGLRLDTTTPSLFCDFYMNNGNINTITVTDSFPIQKWVYVIISVNTQFIDCYLDGKLMNSTKLSSLPIKPPDESVPLILGGSITGATQKFEVSGNSVLNGSVTAGTTTINGNLTVRSTIQGVQGQGDKINNIQSNYKDGILISSKVKSLELG
jgi:hypothetical protein